MNNFLVALVANTILILLITFNTSNVANGYASRVVMTQALISVAWIVNVTSIAGRDWAARFGYIVGGVIGSALGMALSRVLS